MVRQPEISISRSEVTLPAISMAALIVMRTKSWGRAREIKRKTEKNYGFKPKVIGNMKPKVLVYLTPGNETFPITKYLNYRQVTSTLEFEVKELTWPNMAMAYCDLEGQPLPSYQLEKSTAEEVDVFASCSIPCESNFKPLCQVAIAKQGSSKISISEVYLILNQEMSMFQLLRKRVEQSSCHVNIADHLHRRLEGEVGLKPFAKNIYLPEF